MGNRQPTELVAWPQAFISDRGSALKRGNEPLRIWWMMGASPRKGATGSGGSGDEIRGSSTALWSCWSW